MPSGDFAVRMHTSSDSCELYWPLIKCNRQVRERLWFCPPTGLGWALIFACRTNACSVLHRIEQSRRVTQLSEFHSRAAAHRVEFFSERQIILQREMLKIAQQSPVVRPCNFYFTLFTSLPHMLAITLVRAASPIYSQSSFCTQKKRGSVKDGRRLLPISVDRLLMNARLHDSSLHRAETVLHVLVPSDDVESLFFPSDSMPVYRGFFLMSNFFFFQHICICEWVQAHLSCSQADAKLG